MSEGAGRAITDGENGWWKVVDSWDCGYCEMCLEELVCPICGIHWADCPHPSAEMADEYEYKYFGGVEYGRPTDLTERINGSTRT